MPWESIGSTDTGNMPDYETWILFSLKLAKKHIEFVCGSPPPGSTLDIMPNYSELVVFYEYFEPSEYIRVLAAEKIRPKIAVVVLARS
jgi:hypothetical protein